MNNMLSHNNIDSNINNNFNNNIITKISSVDKIIYNTNSIIKNIKIILEHFKSNSNESLLLLFKRLSKKNYNDLNYFVKHFF